MERPTNFNCDARPHTSFTDGITSTGVRVALNIPKSAHAFRVHAAVQL